MKIGYARVSTRDQKADLQVDALTRAGCERLYQDIASGAKTARPALEELLDQARPGDIVVVWKLDRLGRSLKHLVELVGELAARNVGLVSLNDPVDTTSAHGRLIFNLFASLAEFERELLRERTQAGLGAARARGRVGGRPKGLPPHAEATALAAETLYREGRLAVSAIARKLRISKSTLYSYLRHRGVEIGPYAKPPRRAGTRTAPDSDEGAKTATLTLFLRVENNSKFVRGKKRARENIERYHLQAFDMKKRRNDEYELAVPYGDEADLDRRIQDLIADMANEADLRHCFIEADVWDAARDRHW